MAIFRYFRFVADIKRDIGQKLRYFSYPVYIATPGENDSEYFLAVFEPNPGLSDGVNKFCKKSSA